MSIHCNDRAVQRYYHVFKSYLSISKQLENCASQDRDFYLDICFLFATKIKEMQSELINQGFVLCDNHRKFPPHENIGKINK